MTDPTFTIYDDAELPPDTVVELTSVDDDDPLTLEEAPADVVITPVDVHADHDYDYTLDPDVTVAHDDTPDEEKPAL